MHTMKLATKALVGLLATTTLGCSLISPGAPTDPKQSGLKPVGWIYTTLYSKNAVLEINNLQSRAEKEPIIVPNGPRAVAVDPRGRGEFLYVVCELGNTVAVVDRRNRLVNRSIDVGREPYGIALSSVASGQATIDRGFVSNGADDTVSVIDLKTQSVLQTISLRPPQGSTPGQTVPAALRPQGIVVNAAGTRAYVACQGGQVVVVEAAAPNAQFSATRFITLTGSVAPQNIAINSEGTTETVYVTDPQGNRLFVINGSNPTNTADVRDIPNGPWGVAVGRNPQSGKNDRLYVTVKQGGGALLPLSLPDLTSVAQGGAGVSVEGREPTGVAVSPIGDAVYVSLSGSNTVTVFRRVGNDLARPEQFNIQQLSSQFIAPTGDIALGGFLFQ
jgi:YVTN family beta-propeller protein